MSTIQKQTPWQIQKSVIFAIFIRELNARFGRFSLGFIWGFAEPIVYTMAHAVFRGRFTGSTIAGISPMLLFASGCLTFFVFRNPIYASINAVETNQGLFNYQRVKPADTMLARGFLEVLIMLGTGVILFPGLYLMGYTFTWNSSVQLVGVLLCLCMLAAGISFVCCVVGPLWQESKKVIPMIMRPLFFISGIFFPANAVPVQFRGFITWNPVLHALELTREAMFANYTSHEGSWSYLFACSSASLFIGLVVYRYFRVTVITSGYIQ